MDLLLAISPLPVILLCMVVWGKSADVSGALGWVVACAVSCLYFGTDLQVVLRSSLAGVVASLPITMIIILSMLQVTIMEQTGAIKRISALFKCFSTENQAVQVLFLSCAVSIMLSTIGAVPIVLLPSVLLALGYRVFLAIALPVMGYAGTCIVSLLGVPALLLSRFSGIPLHETYVILSKYMFLTNCGVALCSLWVAGGFKLVRQGFIPAVLTGLACWLGMLLADATGFYPVTGFIMGLLMIGFYMAYLALRRTRIHSRDCLGPEDLAAEKRLSLPRAVSPWLGLSLVVIIINTPQLPFHDFINMPMSVYIIPDAPEHIRLLGQAYFWVLILTLICSPLMRARKHDVRAAIGKWRKRAVKPAVAAFSFFALAYVFNYSGLDADWQLISPGSSMMLVTAGRAADALGVLYAGFAPFISLFACIITGSQAAIVALLTNLHMKAAAMAGSSEGLVAAAGAMGAGIASMVSPMKILSAASVLDSPHEGTNVLRSLLGLSLLATLLVAVNCVVCDWF